MGLSDLTKLEKALLWLLLGILGSVLGLFGILLTGFDVWFVLGIALLVSGVWVAFAATWIQAEHEKKEMCTYGYTLAAFGGGVIIGWVIRIIIMIIQLAECSQGEVQCA